MKKQLAKISSIKFGYGGYQGAMFGLSITFSGGGLEISTFEGSWPKTMKRPEDAKWSEQDRDDELLKAVILLNTTLKDAKKEHMNQLVDVPVECILENRMLRSWRVLTEVI